MVIKTLMVLFFITSQSQAGVNFSGLSSDNAMSSDFEIQNRYNIPWFLNRQAAVGYADKIKWVEPHRRYLKNYIERLRKEANHSGEVPTQFQIKHSGVLMQQVEYCQLALDIIERYKKIGAKGDEAMVGSVVIIGEEPYASR